MDQYSSGIHFPSMSGNVLYALPASMPATYAPLSAVTPTSAASGCATALACLAAPNT